MTIETCMSMVDAMAPGPVASAVKLHFLDEIEGRVRVELHGDAPDTVGIIDATTPVTTPLCVPRPYDQLYWLYVAAMLAYTRGDAARYENTAALFNLAFLSYGKWLKRKGA